MSDTPLISIITVNFRSETLLQRLLDSSRSLGLLPPVEWILVNNSPAAIPLQNKLTLPANIPRFEFIENANNRGFGSGCNLGASRAQGSILFFLNPDCCFQGGSFTGMVDLFQRDLQLAALGPRLESTSGKLEFSYAGFPGLCSEARLKLEKRLFQKLPVWRARVNRRFSRFRYVDWVTGGAVFITREAFLKVGGFDEQFFLYFEDADLCRRLHRAGYKIGFDPSFQLIHDHGSSASQAASEVSAHYRRSQIRYYQKHKNLLAQLALEIFLRLTGRYPSA
jgi:GT2 family glycosyltransferase